MSLRILFYSLWLLLGILQAYFTDITRDEAYYWAFSQQLSWGYLDHPPMIALLIKWGHSIFANELGVRLFPILLSTASILVLEKIVQPQKSGIFFLCVSAFALFHSTGILALPDTPLLFFSLTFLWLIKTYIDRNTIGMSILLGINIALLLYSKYHGALLILFTFVGALGLLKRAKTYLAFFIGMLLMLPHLFWQIATDFPTLQLQVADRIGEAYRLADTTSFLAGFLFISTGPLLGVLFLPTFFKEKASNVFQRALKFILIGTLIFFFLFSFSQAILPNWLLICLPPLFIFSYPYLENKKVTSILAGISLLFILGARLFLVYDYLPAPISEKIRLEGDPFHGWKAWAEEIKEKTKGKPIVFFDSFANPSRYTFYTGIPSYTYNSCWCLGSQYDLWGSERSFQGKDVAFVCEWRRDDFDSLQTSNNIKYNYRFIDNYRSYNRIKIEQKGDLVFEKNSQDTILVHFRNMENISFSENENFPTYLGYQYFKDNICFDAEEQKILLTEMTYYEGKSFRLPVRTPKEAGTYKIRIAIYSGWLYPGINCIEKEFEVY